MVGAVIVAHCAIGRELIATAEYLVGKIEGIAAVSIDCKTNASESRTLISKAVTRVDQGDGVILLTDLFGGSPSNIAFSFLNDEKTDVITGVNLPMILTYWSKRESMSLMELVKTDRRSGTRGILRARDLTEKKGAFERGTPTRDRRLSQR